jgi:hypothetical protein
MAKVQDKQETPFNFTRFDGGYFTNLSDPEMQDNELLVAENCEWDGGLRKRRGIQVYSTVTASITIRGAVRAYMAGAWRTFVAKDLGSLTVLHQSPSSATAMASVNMPSASAFALSTSTTAGHDTQFAVIGERVVGVNGYDEPWLIYCDGATASSIVANTIERYDTRYRDGDGWVAGRYAASVTDYTTDYTAQAQSATSTSSFPLFLGTVSTGFFIGCDYTFNKVIFTQASMPGGSVSWTFQYHGYPSYGASATWNTIAQASMIQTTNWATTTTNITLEWPVKFVTEGAQIDFSDNKLPPDIGTSSLALVGGFKYAVRGWTEDATATMGICGLVKIQDTQYLSRLLLDDKPDTVVQHKNHIFMGMGNWVRYSNADTPGGDGLKDWQDGYKQIYRSGGTIKQMVPHNDYLAVILEDKLYGIIGNSWSNWTFKELANHGGVSKRGAAVVGQNLYYIGEDGIWQWNGSQQYNVSKGIKDDIDAWTLTNAAAVEYKDEIWIAFPTNKVMLKADPDTFRADNMGNGRLSFYKFTNFTMNGWLYCKGDSDNGYLLGWDNNGPALMRADNDTSDIVSATASIDFIAETKNLTFDDENAVKQYRRVKLTMADMASAATATDTKCLYQYSFINKDGYGDNTAYATVTVSACASGIFERDVTLPHTMDGKRLRVRMRHSATSTAKFFGFSVGVRRRWF